MLPTYVAQRVYLWSRGVVPARDAERQPELPTAEKDASDTPQAHLVALFFLCGIASALHHPAHDPILYIFGVVLHHPIEARHWAAFHSSKTAFLDLAGKLWIRPTGVVLTHVDT